MDYAHAACPLELTHREISTLLAALNRWTSTEDRNGGDRAIASCGGWYEPLSDTEIFDLQRRLTGPAPYDKGIVTK